MLMLILILSNLFYSSYWNTSLPEASPPFTFTAPHSIKVTLLSDKKRNELLHHIPHKLQYLPTHLPSYPATQLPSSYPATQLPSYPATTQLPSYLLPTYLHTTNLKLMIARLPICKSRYTEFHSAPPF
ncbi:hypothetical protein EYC84_007136 [Monilinia fructicola]|uniref:Uncharacterized protein n=1 Tax=Monilinia fructicola TaxID=38448 RepID=A0A5M9KDT7_MONFR|nr:hypothetical protein EYC84_007136 [Monilinia fructicola]